jgi:hypothetical protein
MTQQLYADISMRGTGALLVTMYENNSDLSTQMLKRKTLLTITSKVMLAMLMKMADVNTLPSIPHSSYHTNYKIVIS